MLSQGEVNKLVLINKWNISALNRRMVSSGFLQEPHGVTTQKTPFFIVTAVKTSNLTALNRFIKGFVVVPSVHFNMLEVFSVVRHKSDGE
jgi:hypothetical protein